MKIQSLLPLCCGLFLFAVCSCSNSENSSAKKDSIRDTVAPATAAPKPTAEASLMDFYRQYITLNARMPVDLKTIDQLQQRYCTTHCLQWIKNDEDLDFDPFLNAQDCDSTWTQSLQVKNKSGNVYEASYNGGPETTYRITLFTTTKNDSIKIDSLAWPM